MHGQNQQRLNLWCPIIINERLDIKTAHTHNHTHTQTKTSNTSTNPSIWMEWAIDGLSIGVTERRIDQPHLCMNTRKHERMGCILWHILHVINRKISQIHTDPHSIGCAISWRVKCPCSVGKWHCCCFCPCKIRYSPCIFPVRTPVIYQMDRGLQKHLQN